MNLKPAERVERLVVIVIYRRQANRIYNHGFTTTALQLVLPRRLGIVHRMFLVTPAGGGLSRTLV